MAKLHRTAIYTMCSVETKTSGYAIKFLEELSKECAEVIVCVSTGIEDALLAQVKAITKQVYRYETLPSANRYKEVLTKQLSEEQLGQMDELVLAEDTLMGPIYPFSEIFEQMSNPQLDFWGVSVHESMPVYGSNEKRRVWPAFIHSSFLVIRSKMLHAPEFLGYWQNYTTTEDPRRTQEQFEYLFTDYFGQLGFCWDVLCDSQRKEKAPSEKFMDCTWWDLNRMLREQRYPFLPTKAFEHGYEEMQVYHPRNDLRFALSYVQKESVYDLKYVYDHIVPTTDLRDLLTRLNLNYTLSDQVEAEEVPESCGVFAYLYYDDLFAYSVEHLLHAPESYDIYIATDTKEKVEQLKALVKEFGTAHHVFFIQTAGVGRDLAALLVAMRPYLMNYELLCFIHDKKSSQMSYETVGRTFNDHLWDNMLYNRAYITQVAKLFHDHPSMGFAGVPMVCHNEYFHTAIHSWTICYDKTLEVANRLGIQILADEKKNPVTLGSAFWCRSKAMEPLFGHAFTYEDFPKEPMAVDGTISHAIERIFPYVAQSQGYYTGIIMNPETVTCYYNVYSETTNQMLQRMNRFHDVATFTLQTTLESMQQSRFSRWYRQFKAKIWHHLDEDKSLQWVRKLGMKWRECKQWMRNRKRAASLAKQTKEADKSN